MYILSPTPSTSDMTSTARPSRHVHTFTYALSVWYDLNSQTSSTCTYIHLRPQRTIRPQQLDLLSHTRRRHLAEIYPSNNIDINELWQLKYSVAGRGIRHTDAHSFYIRYKQTRVLHSNVMVISFITMSSTSSLRTLLPSFHPATSNCHIVTKCSITPNFTQPDIGSTFLQSIFTCLPDHNTVSLTMWQHCDCSLPLNFRPYINHNFQNGDLHTEICWINPRETDHLGDLVVDVKIILNMILNK
jgi:hypothetical protein